jgi:membrane protein implicated in regulation of membrane protease activity
VIEVGVVYVALLIVGAGVIALQLLLGGHDADTHDGDAGHHGDTDHHDGAGSAAGFLAIVSSLRFWTFAAFGSGLTGVLLHYLELAGAGTTLLLALVMGVGLGLVASLAFRLLGKSETSSALESRDAVGVVGRVILPVSKERRGKIRIDVKGQTHDLFATTDETELAPGTSVLIEEQSGDTVRVARAPAEFLKTERS